MGDGGQAKPRVPHTADDRLPLGALSALAPGLDASNFRGKQPVNDRGDGEIREREMTIKIVAAFCLDAGLASAEGWLARPTFGDPPELLSVRGGARSARRLALCRQT